MRTYKTLIFLFFVGAFFVSGGVVSQLFENTGCRLKPRNETFEHANFIGEWLGGTGTTINIKRGSKADFCNGLIFVRDGSLRIEGTQLSISMPGFEKIMTIDEKPRLGDDGLWRMRLNGETFLKKSRDLFV
ncbi:MAG: hypothetical protein ACP5VS_10565 [Desulfomonilaceae bacterium]